MYEIKIEFPLANNLVELNSQDPRASRHSQPKKGQGLNNVVLERKN